MWKGIKDKILHTSKSAGIEVIFLPDGKCMVHVVCLVLHKNKIIVEKQLSGGLEIIEQIPKSYPVYLSFNGRGVFCKKIKQQPVAGDDAENIFPDANPNDFYRTMEDCSDFSVIAIARKNTLTAVINELIEKQKWILHVSIGFHPLTGMLPHIDIGTDQLKTDTYIFKIQKGEITDFDNTSFADQTRKDEFIFSETYIPDTRAIALAGAISVLTAGLNQTSILHNEQIEFQRQDFANYQLFKFWGWTLLIGMLTVLLINFAVFSHYAQKNSELEAVAAFTRGNTINEEKLARDIKHKELFLEHIGWMNQAKASYFADRIASLLPGDILLTSLQFNPLNTTNSSFRQIAFKTNTINAGGDCTSSAYLNQFINNLKNISGIKKVSVLNYQFSKDKETGSFNLEITTD